MLIRWFLGWCRFQHTAARRRLDTIAIMFTRCRHVSTHSRPKAAGAANQWASYRHHSFNTQPPEGGWLFPLVLIGWQMCFNTQPPEGGWLMVQLMMAGI